MADSRADRAEREAVIAIDGPAASGKSTTARQVAERLGYRHADSGALYRALTAARLRRAGDPSEWTERSLLEAARDVAFVEVATGCDVRLAGAAADEELRGTAVTAHVSLVARMPGVRAWVRERMRECARAGPIVVDGRDMGTVVFPLARLKVFLVADARERARRRLVQRPGRDRAPTAAEIGAETRELERRDAKDAPQTQRAADAVVIDTTPLSQDEQVERIVALARSRWAGQVDAGQ